jgi:hypothetical protein
MPVPSNTAATIDAQQGNHEQAKPTAFNEAEKRRVWAHRSPFIAMVVSTVRQPDPRSVRKMVGRGPPYRLDGVMIGAPFLRRNS